LLSLGALLLLSCPAKEAAVVDGDAARPDAARADATGPSPEASQPAGDTRSLVDLPIITDLNVTIDAATTFQTVSGVGSNVHSWSWKGGEAIAALDHLVQTLGHSQFRVIHDTMEWAGGGATRPAATLAGLQSLDPATLKSVYETPAMQALWSTIGHLNSRGVAGEQLMVNFMGWTAPWMGGSGAYGTASKITNNTQTNQDIATMLASLVYYGHHRKDVSGQHQNLSFSTLAPFNEIDHNGLEGPQISPAQLNTIYGNLLTRLTAMGETQTRLVGPDTAGGPDSYTSAFSAAVRAGMSHFAWHSYSASPSSPAAARSGIEADWMTETSKWCSGCDSNQPPGESEWSFGSAIGDLILGDLDSGFTSVLTWEGYDTFYFHHDSYSAWGHVGCTQAGKGCTTSDAAGPRSYAIRGRAYPEATIAQGARPGMKRVKVESKLPDLTLLAFHEQASGRLSLVGHNLSSSSRVLNVKVDGAALAAKAMEVYFTSQQKHLEKQASALLGANRAFTVTVPADTFFVVRSW